MKLNLARIIFVFPSSFVLKKTSVSCNQVNADEGLSLSGIKYGLSVSLSGTYLKIKARFDEYIDPYSTLSVVTLSHQLEFFHLEPFNVLVMATVPLSE